MLKKIKIGLLGLCLTFSFGANAWDGAVSGKIAGIDVTGATNYAFRVTLDGSPALCGNTNTWAYINGSNDNYQTYVSALMAAYYANKTVVLYTNQLASHPNGYCLIGYVAVR